MPATYEPIATTTLGSAATAINFNSISGTYTDLKLVVVYYNINGAQLFLQFNSDTGTNYSRTMLRGNGTTASSNRQTSVAQIASLGPIDHPTLVSFDIFSYTASVNKTVLMTQADDSNGSGSTQNSVALWRNTAAITSINLSLQSAETFPVGTTATLFGILKA